MERDYWIKNLAKAYFCKNFTDLLYKTQYLAFLSLKQEVYNLLRFVEWLKIMVKY